LIKTWVYWTKNYNSLFIKNNKFELINYSVNSKIDVSYNLINEIKDYQETINPYQELLKESCGIIELLGPLICEGMSSNEYIEMCKKTTNLAISKLQKMLKDISVYKEKGGNSEEILDKIHQYLIDLALNSEIKKLNNKLFEFLDFIYNKITLKFFFKF
jgi:hypothetical protein